MTDKPDDRRGPACIRWPSSAFLLVLLEPGQPTDTSSPWNSLLFVELSAEGLEALEKTQQSSSSMWLFTADEQAPGNLHSEQIQEIATWNLQTQSGRPLHVLHGQNGRVIAIEGDGAFLLNRSTDWVGAGAYKRES